MTIKVYVSGICGSQEVRKQQQRVLFILQSLPIDLQIIDVTEPGRDEDLNFMQENAKNHEKKTQLPPQIFNDDAYCGDYTDFELANDDDEIMKFLKMEDSSSKNGVSNDTEASMTQNGISVHNGVLDSTEERDTKISEDISMGENKETEPEPMIIESDPDLIREDEDEKTEIVLENVEENDKDINETNEDAKIISEEEKESEEEESE